MWNTFKELALDWRYKWSLVCSLIGAAMIAVAEPSRWYIGLLIALATPLSLLINVLMQRAYVRRMGGGDTAADLRVTQTRVFVLDVPFEEAFESCVASLRTLRGGRVGRCSRKKGTVSGRSAMTWRTLGNRIRFQLTRLDESTTQVELTSHPLYQTTLVDYGTNYDNAERLTATLGVRPDQYLLRASRAGEPEGELLRAATGSQTDCENLLRPDLPEESKSYTHADDNDQQQSLLHR